MRIPNVSDIAFAVLVWGCVLVCQIIDFFVVH